VDTVVGAEAMGLEYKQWDSKVYVGPIFYIGLFPPPVTSDAPSQVHTIISAVVQL